MELVYKSNTTTLRCTTEELQIILQGDALQHRQEIGIATYETTTDSDLFAKIIQISKGENNYFRALNNALRELDKAGLDLILIEQPPESEEYRSVNEMLRKKVKPLVKVDSDWDVVDTSIAAAVIYDLFND